MTDTPARPPVRVGDPAVHLRIERDEPATITAELAERAARNLASMSALGTRLRAHGATRSNHGEEPVLLAAGFTAYALVANAHATPTFHPPVATLATVQTLAEAPDLLLSRGDLGQIEPAIADLARTWQDEHWRNRIVSAIPTSDDRTLLAHASNHAPQSRAQVRRLLEGARMLARTATSRYLHLRIALDAIPGSDRSYTANVPTLTPFGIELSALARFGVSCIRADEDPVGHIYVTARTSAQLMLCRPRPTRTRQHPASTQPRASRSADEVLRTVSARPVLDQFFDHAQYAPVTNATAGLLGCPPDTVLQHLGEMRAALSGRRFHVVTDR